MTHQSHDERLRLATFAIDAGDCTGTGFLITDRHVLTARHVVENALAETRQVRLTRPGVDKVEWIAQIVPGASGRAESQDFAILEVVDASGAEDKIALDADAIPLGIPSENDRWKSWGFPRKRDAADGTRRGWALSGDVVFTDQSWRGGRVTQLTCTDLQGRDRPDLHGASGGAVCVSGRAIGILVADARCGAGVFASPIPSADRKINPELAVILGDWYARESKGIRARVIGRLAKKFAQDPILFARTQAAMVYRQLAPGGAGNDQLATACLEGPCDQVGLCLKRLHESAGGENNRDLARGIYDLAVTMLPAFTEWQQDVAAVRNALATAGVAMLGVSGEAMVEVVMAAHDVRSCDFITSSGRGVVGRHNLPVHQPGQADQASGGIDFNHDACLRSILAHFEEQWGVQPADRAVEQELERLAGLPGDDACRYYVVIARSEDNTVKGNIATLRSKLPSLRIVVITPNQERDRTLADFRILVNSQLWSEKRHAVAH